MNVRIRRNHSPCGKKLRGKYSWIFHYTARSQIMTVRLIINYGRLAYSLDLILTISYNLDQPTYMIYVPSRASPISSLCLLLSPIVPVSHSQPGSPDCTSC